MRPESGGGTGALLNNVLNYLLTHMLTKRNAQTESLSAKTESPTGQAESLNFQPKT